MDTNSRSFAVFHAAGYMEKVEVTSLGGGESAAELRDNEGRKLAKLTDTGNDYLLSFGSDDEGFTLGYDQADFVCSLVRATRMADSNPAEVDDANPSIYQIARVEEVTNFGRGETK